MITALKPSSTATDHMIGAHPKGVLPFLLSLIACALLLFAFPEIAVFLPNLLMGQ